MTFGLETDSRFFFTGHGTLGKATFLHSPVFSHGPPALHRTNNAVASVFSLWFCLAPAGSPRRLTSARGAHKQYHRLPPPSPAFTSRAAACSQNSAPDRRTGAKERFLTIMSRFSGEVCVLTLFHVMQTVVSVFARPWFVTTAQKFASFSNSSFFCGQQPGGLRNGCQTQLQGGVQHPPPPSPT